MNYQSLLEHFRKIRNLYSTRSLLTWDTEVSLPRNSIHLRNDQITTLDVLIHRELTDAEFLEGLRQIPVPVDPIEKRNIQLMRAQAFEAAAFSSEFANRKSQIELRLQNSWKEARNSQSFSSVIETFKEHLSMQHEYVEQLKSCLDLPDLSKLSSYDVLLYINGAGIQSHKMELLFGKLKSELIQRVRDFPPATPSEIPKLSESRQREIIEKMIFSFGFSKESGRFDFSNSYPFCGGSPGDVRITSCLSADNFMDTLLSTIHEVGHGIYEQNIPPSYIGLPVGVNIFTSVHESQSRFLENQIARSDGFITFLQKEFNTDRDLTTIIRPRLKSPSRVQSDEVAYNLHIIIRWELERALLSGDLQVQDLPEAWSELYKKYLNIQISNDNEGCLQDIQWSLGYFGWFPTYTVGNLIAANLFSIFKNRHQNWQRDIANGDLYFINSFLNQQVHRHAALYDFDNLIARALDGKDISVESFIEYLDERYER